MEYYKEIDYDYREAKLSDPKYKKYLDDFVKERIELMLDAKRTSQIDNIIFRNILYYEGKQRPLGFTSSSLADFVRKNQNLIDLGKADWVVTKDDNNQIYYVDNQIKPFIDGVTGEYTNIKKVVSVISDAVTENDGIEKAMRSMYSRLETKKKIWEHVRIPAIRWQSMGGLGASRIDYNPRRNFPHGDIDILSVDPRDILLDPDSTHDFFIDMEYCAYMETVTTERAQEKLKRYDVTQKLTPESMEADERNIGRQNFKTDNRKGYVTIYYFEFRKLYIDSYLSKRGLSDMGIDISGDIEQDREYYFNVVYTKQTGVVDIQINQNTFSVNEYNKYKLTLYPNRRAYTRVYPLTDPEELCAVQDIINIAKTLVLDNARQRNLVRLFINRKVYDENKALFKKIIRHGGIAPLKLDGDEVDINKYVHWFEVPGLPKEIYQFLELAENTFKTLSDRNEPLSGNYPDGASMPSGKALDILIAQNRKRISFKDIAINNGATEEAQKIYSIIASEYKYEYRYRKTDTLKKDEMRLGLINGIMTYPEYLEFLKENNTTPENFTKYNEVYTTRPRVENPRTIAQGKHRENVLVFINHLSEEDDRIEMKVSVDVNAERDSTENKLIAKSLLESGLFPEEMFYDMLGGFFAENKQEIIDLMKQKNFAKQLIGLIEEVGDESGEFQQALMQFVQTWIARARGEQAQA